MTYKELQERQSWTLEQKIDHSLGIIEKFYNELNGKVYVSFSGGKDSTVLLWLCRRLYPDIKVVFCNTRMEYPSIVRFVRETQRSGVNLEIIQPRRFPRDIICKGGFPLVSKLVAEQIRSIRTNPDCDVSLRYLGNNCDGIAKRFAIGNRWKYLLNTPYHTSALCCMSLKEYPFRKFEKQTGLNPILGIMASESASRAASYVKSGGCNTFSKDGCGRNISRPLSIWTDDDIWECIRRFNIKIADIYETGIPRTGCVACGFGAYHSDDNRLQVLYERYPKLYNMIMNYENNGVKYRVALREMLRVVGRYLPDEQPENLFSALDS